MPDFCYKDGQKLNPKVPEVRLAICTIALSDHQTEVWMNHMKGLYKELDLIKDDIQFSYKHLFVFDKSYEVAREEITEQVLTGKYTHMLFIDCDTFIPRTAIKVMLQTVQNYNYQVLCLPVYLKMMPLVSNIYEDVMFAPISKLPREIFKIDLTGLAAVLINVNVFSKIEKPYYIGEWRVLSTETDVTFHLKTKEDTAFFFKLKRKHIDVYCDPHFICEHYDKENDRFYPSLVGNKQQRCYDE